MNLLTYTSYIEHIEIYTEIPGSIVVNSSQIELARKDIILLSDVTLTLCKTGLLTSAQDIHKQFFLSAGTYSIDDFNAKVKEAVLRQKQIKFKTYSWLYQSITHTHIYGF